MVPNNDVCLLFDIVGLGLLESALLAGKNWVGIVGVGIVGVGIIAPTLYRGIKKFKNLLDDGMDWEKSVTYTQCPKSMS